MAVDILVMNLDSFVFFYGKHENTDTSKFKIKEIKAGSCIFYKKAQDEGQKKMV